MAYSRVSSSGFISALDDYNSSGTHNSVTRPSVGRAVVTVPNASTGNASIMVTANAGVFAGSHVCSLVSWVGNQATIECRSPSGALVNTAFTFLYATSGPPVEQQGAHALFDGTSVNPSQSAALGRISWCSPASVTGSRSGSVATVVVAGDLGSWDASPFVRASFATPQGAAGYCKIEGLSTLVTASESRSTTQVRCYTATGDAVSVPVFRFTHVTSDPSGPC